MSWAGAGAGGEAEGPIDSSTEYRVKAACMFNFARFLEWPPTAFADATTPILLGVLGKDPFGDILERSFGKQTAGGRRFIIKRFTKLDEIHACHILFIGRSESQRLAAVFLALRGRPVVTISEIDGFARAGGIFQLLLRDKKVHFEINNESAKRVGLSISSKLLRIGTPVSGEAEE